MKNLFFILLAFAPAWLLAQKDSVETTQTTNNKKEQYEMKTFAPGGKMSHGGYFALTTHYSRIMGQDVFSAGVSAKEMGEVPCNYFTERSAITYKAVGGLLFFIEFSNTFRI